MNFPVLLLTSLIPLVIGFIWYNNFLFGKAWMKASGMTEEKMKGGNMAVIFGLTYVFSIMASMVLMFLVIHQASVPSIFMGDPDMLDKNTELGRFLELLNTKYAYNYRTFKHGMFHGTIAGLFFALPVIGMIALFERKGWRYILIHAGFWTLCLMLMGGVLCQFM
ncbi:MAG: DUF1761 domain-containing protein [Bacteroidia bacterium]|nr:DUF1761 domain-containing protein [Bacteroidia bacterium]